MIELLGVGVPRRDRGWLLHHVCARLEAGDLTTVLSADSQERRALLDAITGRRLPDEGRVWIDRVPVMPDSLRRVRRLCGDVDPADGRGARRSVFWNPLERVGLQAYVGEPVAALSPFERVRLLVARAVARRPRYLVVRDPDASLSAGEIGALLRLLRLLARSEHLGVVVSLAEGAAGQELADRVLLLHEGVLLFHGRPDAPPAARGVAGDRTRAMSVAGGCDVVGLLADPSGIDSGA